MAFPCKAMPELQPSPPRRRVIEKHYGLDELTCRYKNSPEAFLLQQRMEALFPAQWCSRDVPWEEEEAKANSWPHV